MKHLLTVLLALLLAAAALADEPPSEPLLRMETGAMINRIAAASQGGGLCTLMQEGRA